MSNIRPGNWIPKNMLYSIEFEYLMHPEEEHGNPEKTHRRLMRESLPFITLQLRDTALNDLDPKVRLQATGMILDRVLGKASTTADLEETPAEALFTDLNNELEKLLTLDGN